MTNRLQALEAVAEAAEILAHSSGVIRGRTPEDADLYTVELEHIRELNAALATLSALPREDEDEGQPVEVAVWKNDYGSVVFSVAGSRDDRPTTAGYWRRLGTTRLAVKKGEGA